MQSSFSRPFLLLLGGLGGLLCGIDFGIIAVSMPYIRALMLYNDLQIGWIVGGCAAS